MASQENRKNVGRVELIFHVVSENVDVFDIAPWESAPFANLFSKSQKSNFENRFFFFVHWHQEKECATILIAPNFEFYPGVYFLGRF